MLKSAQMGTGQQFLMPKNSSKIDLKLSIHIFNDGFYFSSNSEKNYFLFEDINIFDEKEFGKFLNLNEIDDQNQLKLIFFDNPSMFTPFEFHAQENSKQLLSNYTELKTNHKVVSDITEDNKVCIIYQISKKMEKTLNKCFNQIYYYHYSKILYDDLQEFIKPYSDTKIRLFINLQKNIFDLFLMESNNLLVYNSFPHSNSDDFMYYLFALIEEYKLSSDSLDILFLEKFDNYSNYYLGVNNFHDNVKFVENDTQQNIHSNHPAPYFMNIL